LGDAIISHSLKLESIYTKLDGKARLPLPKVAPQLLSQLSVFLGHEKITWKKSLVVGLSALIIVVLKS
jgi:hypothetical protein